MCDIHATWKKYHAFSLFDIETCPVDFTHACARARARVRTPEKNMPEHPKRQQNKNENEQISFESRRGVYVKHTTTSDPRKGGKGQQRRRVVMTRMSLPAARSAANVAASTAHLSATAAGTMTSTLARPVTLATSGLSTLGHATMSTLNALAYTLHHGTVILRRDKKCAVPCGVVCFLLLAAFFPLPQNHVPRRMFPSWTRVVLHINGCFVSGLPLAK